MDRDLVAALTGNFAVSVETAARAFNVGPTAVRAGIERKEIPTTGFGRVMMIPTAFIRERLMLDAQALKDAA